MTYSSANTE